VIKTVRLDREQKKPVDKEWQKRDFSLADHKRWVACGGNIGLQMGECSGWWCVVDQDCPEGEQLAPSFLGKTLALRKGTERPSIYVYRSPGLGYKQYRDINDEVIMDLKASDNGKGHQITAPPSIHPTKGAYEWVGGFDPAAIAEVPKEELRAAVGKLAVATLIARHLPATGRHNLAMALAGYLLR
jgi:bifunctional DNA primase/polymerase-like protein